MHAAMRNDTAARMYRMAVCYHDAANRGQAGEVHSSIADLETPAGRSPTVQHRCAGPAGGPKRTDGSIIATRSVAIKHFAASSNRDLRTIECRTLSTMVTTRNR